MATGSMAKEQCVIHTRDHNSPRVMKSRLMLLFQADRILGWIYSQKNGSDLVVNPNVSYLMLPFPSAVRCYVPHVFG